MQDNHPNNQVDGSSYADKDPAVITVSVARLYRQERAGKEEREPL